MNFNLTRRFTLLALIGITTVAVVSSAWLSRYLTEKVLHRDGELTAQFVQSLTSVQRVSAFFSGDNQAAPRDVAEFFEHLAAVPDVLHANVYSREHRVLWSTKKEMIGQVLPDNHELDDALKGELEIESDVLEERKYFKLEHIYLPRPEESFIETYIPVFDRERKNVLGVVELYRTPRALFETASGLVRRVWASALLGALLLFVSLLWLTRLADRIMRSQQRQLVETERLAAVGEMSTAVAHSLRNPLASIRSSAELALDLHGPARDDATRDIMSQVDRVAAWVKNLLIYAQPTQRALQPVDIAGAVNACLADYAPEFAKRKIALACALPESLPKVVGDEALLTQVMNNLVSNALEAMPDAGSLSIAAQERPPGRVALTVTDNGEGMTPEQLQRVFSAFSTSKKGGLGVGLPMVKSVIERFGGSVKIDSALGKGTSIELELPLSR